MFGLVVLVLFLWRIPFLIIAFINLQKSPPAVATAKSKQYRNLIYGQLYYMWLDILHIPFLLIALLLLITIWRAPELFTKKLNTRRDLRKNTTKQLLLWLWDIPTSFMLFLLTITIYRAFQVYPPLVTYAKRKYGSSSNNTTTFSGASTAPEDEENPRANSKQQQNTDPSYHFIINRQFLLLLLDVPFPILALFTFWRLPWLLKNVIKEVNLPTKKKL